MTEKAKDELEFDLELFTIYKVWGKHLEGETVSPEWLELWRKKHLTGRWYQNYYEKIKERMANPKKGIVKAIRIIGFTVKYFWPTIALIALPFFAPFLSILFAFIPLVLVQIIAGFVFAINSCIVAFATLEKSVLDGDS